MNDLWYTIREGLPEENVMIKQGNLDTYSLAITYMNDNLYAKFNMEQIARYCNVSCSGLEKIFARYTGGGVMQYYSELKLERSRKLLLEGYKVGKVAELLCFSSCAHFSAAFKRKYGIPPLRYKLGERTQ